MFNLFNRREKIIAQQLRAVLAAFSETLPQADLDFAEDLIHHGEFGEALDTICTQVYEHEIPVTIDTYRVIEDCGRRMEMSASCWRPLTELLVDG